MLRLGIDLGGTNIAVGLIDEMGAILCKHSRPTGVGRGAEPIIADMKLACIELCEKYGCAPSEVASIGIGLPGSINKKERRLIFGTNLGFHNTSFAHSFEPEFPCPVYVDNDANCAALGECVAGAGKGCKDVIMITLGTGIGGGIILDGKIVTGFNDAAGELGHMIIRVGGEPCNCGRRGCWETYASASAIVRKVKAAMQLHPESQLNAVAQEQGKIGAYNLFLARDRGDAVAQEIFDEYVADLACGIGNLISIFQPEKLIVGGGVIGQGDKLLNPVRDIAYNSGMTVAGPKTEIVAATTGNDAGIIGAAMLDR